MDIKQLKFLIALDETRHFGQAAALCHITQPTLSMRLRNLEDELDLVLVKRGQRFEGFTAPGERVLAWARTVLTAHDGLLAEAAACLVGEHDFTSFRAAECQARSPVRLMHSVSVQRRGDVVLFDFHANAFLHHMIRNLVGSLVFVGKGRRPVGWMAELLAARNRSLAAPTFAPDGLYLCGVDYPPQWPLPGGGRIIAPPQLLLP